MMRCHPSHILLIEDNPGDADLVCLCLADAQAQVEIRCVTHLAAGLASLLECPPSLVLLDLNLPDSHGSDTFQRILETAPTVPVVILSGQDDEELAIKAIHQGAQDYLVKGSLTSLSLERAIHYAVERQALLRSLDMSRKQQIDFKNQFLSHVSHELRTPLTCIHQYVSLLFDGLAGSISPDQRAHLQTVLKSVHQLQAMIKDLLEATRAESGKTRIEPRCLALADLLRESVAMMQPLAREHHIHLALSVDSLLPLAYADPDRILGVVLNLIDNAIKFTPPEGNITVSASTMANDPDFVYISVADTGRGISPEALPLIFERLYQDPSSADTNRSGLGLGLYIAKEMVTLNGGQIWATSQIGCGSTFSIKLPKHSLAKLLMPIVLHKGRLRDSLVLVRVDLAPLPHVARAHWRETCLNCLDLLRRCVHIDTDLVLPPLAATSLEESFYILASTDMVRVNIMIARIAEQIAALPHFQSNATITVTAKPVARIATDYSAPLASQVEAVATHVTQLITADLHDKGSHSVTQRKQYANA